ncbi:glycosyl hydrolase [Cohnella sp. CFH 77786]|uniref:glycosyl hydrolase n=1 Tax=Cohnella sp. CFH 77786 TaxID=2662265 RepID=UPI001C60C6F0|nr:glycosyl hydrolase [Cohnella sp. CFH 77786]
MTRWMVRVCFSLAAAALLWTTTASPQAEAALAAKVNVWRVYGEANKAKGKNDYKTAIAKYLQIAPLFAEKKDYNNAALMYNNAGDLQSKLGLYDDAVASWDLEAAAWAMGGKTQESIAAKRKADWIRSRFELFVQDGSAAGSVYHGVKYEPKNGALIGAYAENDPAVHASKNGEKFYMTDFPELTGKKHAMYLLYTVYDRDAGTNFFESYKRHIEIAKRENVALEVALQPSKGLDQVEDDGYLRELARSAKEAGIPIFLRFANEMNGDWVEWYSPDPATYIEKFRVVAKAFHEEAPNVVMVWSPNYFPPDNIEKYYPGDDAVDWVGVSMYQTFNGSLDPLKKSVDRSSYVEKFDRIYKLYAKKKPIMLSEGAVSYTDPVMHTDRNAWAAYQTRVFYESLPLLYPGVKAVVWFDATKKERGRLNSYTLSASSELLGAYKQSIGNPYYLSAVGEESVAAFKPLASGTITAGRQTIAAYIKTVSPILGKAEYWVNGKKAATVTSAPWKFDYDFTSFKGKTVDLTVKAFDDKGVIVSSKTDKLTVR